MGAGILFVAALLAVLFYLDADDQVRQLLQWFEQQGAWAAVLFIVVMVGVVVLLLPGVLFTTGAGFVFGVVEGSLYVVLGTTLGAMVAFLIARHAFGQRARNFVLSHARLHLVQEELRSEGWKIVLLTRLVPFFPSKLANYFFGLTPVRLGHFTLGSLLGFIPFSVHNVYLGSIASDLAALGTDGMNRSPFQWLVYLLGFIATVIAVIYLNRIARRALARYTQGDTDDSMQEQVSQ
ncbi:TVP38/TMEM64 family protein [Wenzhouxiangella sp. XN24]|uniref:TVP38/TMEM64 family protein n=1 Tax=Wenzhouxiangella sp. XN24 TaxID=2713569 RepID=UPI001F0E5EB4|nr:TVP38/TMEM64 family protein [Wenzhouxiangella sp. XN24]